MELKEDFIKDNKLDEDQVKNIKAESETQEAELKKGWDSKANDDAEAIIEGAGEKTVTLTGIKRDQGEKWAAYLTRSSDLFFTGTKKSYEDKIKILDEKIKNSKGDEVIKKELEEATEKLDLLQKQEAKFADWEEHDYKGKFEALTIQVGDQVIEGAFQGVKPNFPDTVNEYEANGRWGEFKKDVLDKNTITVDKDKVAYATDKENKHKVTKLKDLVTQHKGISELAKGREFKGLDSDNKAKVSIEGVPFKVPENATPKERQKAIKEYLTGELKLRATSSEYAKQYSDFNQKLLEKKPAKKT